MAIDKATSAKVTPPPAVYSWLDWRRDHPRIRVRFTGEDGDMEAWKGLWTTYGRASMDEMYTTLIGTYAAGKALYYAEAAQWLADPHPVSVGNLVAAVSSADAELLARYGAPPVLPDVERK